MGQCSRRTGGATVERRALSDADANTTFTCQVQEAAEGLFEEATTALPVGVATMTRDAAAETDLSALRVQIGDADAKAVNSAMKLKRARASLAKAEAEDIAAQCSLSATRQAGLVDLELFEGLALTLKAVGIEMPDVISHRQPAAREPEERPALRVVQEEPSRARPCRPVPGSHLRQAARNGRIDLALPADDAVPSTDSIVDALPGKAGRCPLRARSPGASSVAGTTATGSASICCPSPRAGRTGYGGGRLERRDPGRRSHRLD